MGFSSEYVRFAHRRSVWAELQRIIQTEYLGTTESTAAKPIVCEEVPMSHSNVSKEVLSSILNDLEDLQHTEYLEMMQFDMRRRDAKRAAAEAKSAQQEKPDQAGTKVEGAPEPASTSATGEVGVTVPSTG